MYIPRQKKERKKEDSIMYETIPVRDIGILLLPTKQKTNLTYLDLL